MVISHNLNALNAGNRLNTNVIGTKKSTEKLSSGLQINRAADNAAGLAISEKMRAQIRGLHQAINNANDGISLIQTAEGGLNETHAILQRIRELAVQSANGTYLNETDREAMQLEVDRLKAEIDRIAESTEYNKIKLLDGSLSGMEFSVKSFYGARYGTYQYSAAFSQYISVASSIAGISVEFTTDASGLGGENAEWSADGKSINIKLSQGQVYTDAQINGLIKNAVQAKNGAQTNAPASIEWKTDNGQIIAADFTTASTIAGVRQKITIDLLPLQASGGIENTNAIFADKIQFTANQYGSHKDTAGLLAEIKIVTDADAGKENISIDTPAAIGAAGAKITIHLATGTEYSSQYIEQLMLKAGFDYTVETRDEKNPDGGKTIYLLTHGEVKADASAYIIDPYTSVDFGYIEVEEGDDFWVKVDSFSMISYGNWPDLNLVAPNGATFGYVSTYLNSSGPSSILAADNNPLVTSADYNGWANNQEQFDMFGVKAAGAGKWLIQVRNSSNVTSMFSISTSADHPLTITYTGSGVSSAGADGQGLGKSFINSGGDGLILQIGANGVPDQKMSVYINDMGASALGVANVDVSTQDAANAAIETVDNAINRVSLQRASLGAAQNRLEYTVNNLTVTEENLTAAESQIRDTDMAKEMVEYTKYSILQQAAQAMLAQANQSTQSVLTLLR